MKIIRNDKVIELTPNELFEAYEEQEHIFDVENVELVLDSYNDEDLIENYGMTRDQMAALMDEMAYRMRRYMDRYEMSLEYARDDAIRDVVNEHKKLNHENVK